MKKNMFTKLLLMAAVALFAQTTANAQIGSLINKARNAAKQEAGKAKEEVKEEAEAKAAEAAEATLGDRPPCPWTMSVEAMYNPNDYSDPKNINAFLWNLEKLETDEVQQLRDAMDARFRSDMELANKVRQGVIKSGTPLLSEYMNVRDEIERWETFYSAITRMFDIAISGLTYSDGGFSGVEDARYLVVSNKGGGLGACAVGTLGSDCKFVDIFSSGGDKFLDEETIAQAQNAVKRMKNVKVLCYNLKGLVKETGYDNKNKRLTVLYNLANMYAGVTEKAIEHNKPENIERKPRPAAGSLHASLKAKALAIAKASDANVTDVIITSNAWDVKKNGVVITHRSVYGYYLVKDANGTMAVPRAWTEKHLGNGKYGDLQAGGVGVSASFYIK